MKKQFEGISLEQKVRLSRWLDQLDLGHKKAELGLTFRSDKKRGAKADGGLLSQIEREIQLGSSFHEFSSLAFLPLESDPISEVAARLVEWAFLHGTSLEVISTLKKLQKKDLEDFYLLVQPEVRRILLLRLWLERSDGVLKSHLLPDSVGLLDIEQLYVFCYLAADEDPVMAFMFYRDHELGIRQAIRAHGERLSLSEGEVLVSATKLALQLDYEGEAERLLSSVGKEDPAFGKAMELFLQLRVERNEAGLCMFGQKLEAEPHWQQRIKLLYQFLGEVRRVGTLKHKNRPALNDLLRDLLKFIPELPEAYAALSQLLLYHHDLKPMLPNIFYLFEDHALKFLPRELEEALWRPVSGFSETTLLAIGLRALSWFHLYLVRDLTHEPLLWDAFEVFQELAPKIELLPLPDWLTLKRKALAHVGKYPGYDEVNRARLLRQLAVATDDRHLIGSDVARYLSGVSQPPYRVLHKLHEKVQATGLDELELQIIQKKAQIAHFTNHELDRLWTLACKWQHYDLAWRIASVLKARGVLHEDLVHAWSISGEKRDDFVSLTGTRLVVQGLLAELKSHEKKLLEALLQVGPLLPDLLYILDPKAKVRRSKTPSNPMEQSVQKQLEELSWLPKAKKDYIFSFEAPDGTGLRTPRFIEILPRNPWSLGLVLLANRLGLSAWGFSLKRLNLYLGDVIPRSTVARQGPTPTKIAKWLKNLTPRARQAWYDLPALLEKVGEEDGFEIQAKLLTRLALLINQNHYQALSSLRVMRVPLWLIWDLEAFLLSPDYAQIRTHVRGSKRMVVPQTLQNRESILGLPTEFI